MTDLERFCAAMGGEWVVEHYSLEDGERKLRVHYRSRQDPALVWSHVPLAFEQVQPVGTVGRIGFIGTRKKDAPA